MKVKYMHIGNRSPGMASKAAHISFGTFHVGISTRTASGKEGNWRCTLLCTWRDETA